jgi:hypothetical protein
MRSLGLLTQLLAVALTSQMLLAAPVSEPSFDTDLSLSVGAAPGVVSHTHPPAGQMQETLEKRGIFSWKSSIQVNGQSASPRKAKAIARKAHTKGDSHVEVTKKGDPKRRFPV